MHHNRAINRLTLLTTTLRQQQRGWWGMTLGFTAAYYLVLMASLITRFQRLPNYMIGYDWFSNVYTIIVSTPSLKDTVSIIADEWVLEVGFMNYDFGTGISEWSLFLAPVQMLVVMALGALLTTYYLLIRRPNRICAPMSSQSSNAAAGVGATCVALTSITMSWVVCCATPTWVVGLAIMGVGVSTSLWLEPLGGWLRYVGFIGLLVGVWIAAKPTPPPHPAQPVTLTTRFEDITT